MGKGLTGIWVTTYCDRSDKLILKGVLRAPVTAAWTVQSADLDKAGPHQEFRTAWSCVELRKCVPNRLHHCSDAESKFENPRVVWASNSYLSGRGLQFAAITIWNWHGCVGGDRVVAVEWRTPPCLTPTLVGNLGCRELTCLWLVELLAIL